MSVSAYTPTRAYWKMLINCFDCYNFHNNSEAMALKELTRVYGSLILKRMNYGREAFFGNHLIAINVRLRLI